MKTAQKNALKTPQLMPFRENYAMLLYYSSDADLSCVWADLTLINVKSSIKNDFNIKF